MKTILTAVFAVFALSVATACQAACENEASTRGRFSQWCERSKQASALAFIGGSAFLPPFGGLIGGLFVQDASIACSKSDEWKARLGACLELEASVQRFRAEMSEEAMRFVRDFATYMEIYTRWDSGKVEIMSTYREKFTKAVEGFAAAVRAEGNDPAAPEHREGAERLVRELTLERSARLAQVDEDANREVREKDLSYVVRVLLRD